MIDFLLSFGNLSSAVGIAIVIFLSKELIDIHRKREELKRKLEAIKGLISEEL